MVYNEDDIEVSMFIPDTIPGPGTYKVKMDSAPEYKGEIPKVTPLESIEEFRGRGTADDVASSDLTPDKTLMKG